MKDDNKWSLRSFLMTELGSYVQDIREKACCGFSPMTTATAHVHTLPTGTCSWRAEIGRAHV